jgi:hypothetical protein
MELIGDDDQVIFDFCDLSTDLLVEGALPKAQGGIYPLLNQAASYMP